MLLGNYSVLNKSPGRFLGGSTTSVQVTVPSNWQKSGAGRNSLYVSQTTAALVLYAIPSGNYAGKTWMLPQKTGEMESRNDAVISVSATASGALGVNIDGLSSAVFGVPNADLQLVVSASGSASAIFSQTGALAGALSASGSSAFSIAVPSVLLGAIVNAIGPATATLSGTATPSAIGNLAGDITPYTELSPQNLASAVWSTVIEAGFTADQILRILSAHAAGAATGLEGANPQFTGIDGTTLRIDGSYSAGTRTIDALNGA
ncbi:MAG TPA: hypothetical protein PKY40_07725 [Burkholderiaceae bacterium]|nr:hypothetical protein [Burkholderiaceae bacterium]